MFRACVDYAYTKTMEFHDESVLIGFWPEDTCQGQIQYIAEQSPDFTRPYFRKSVSSATVRASGPDGDSCS